MKGFVRIIAVCVCVALLLTGIALLLPGRALADNNARDYIPAPPGILAVLAYYEHVSAQNFFTKGSNGAGHGGTNDLGFTANIGILRTIYYCDIPTPFGPLRAAPQFLIPFGETDLSGALNQGNTISASGFAAPILASQFWLLHNDKTKTYVGITPFVFLNVGQYDDTKQILPTAINLGTNRWQFRQELNLTQGVQVIPGHNAYFEITIGGDEFTNNYSFGAAHQTLTQKPTLNVESHVSYDITKAVFASLDYYGHYGGNYEILARDGIPGAKVGALGESALGASLAYSFAPGFQLMLQYRGDVAVANGPQANIFLARFLWATDLNSILGNPQAKK